MTSPNYPTGADMYRLRSARSRARAEVVAARTAFQVARRAAFRRELATTVRWASPFLVGLLANDGLELDDVVRRIGPVEAWPSRPRLSSLTGRRKDGGPCTPYDTAHGILLPLDDGGSADVRIVAHSIEVRTRIGGLACETRFGELRITTQGAVPHALAAGAVGRRVEDIVGHPATDGRGWRIASAENVLSVTVFTIRTGSVPWSIE